MSFFINAFVQFLVLLTPFFALSMFVLYTADMGASARHRLAFKVTLAVLLISILLFFLGQPIFLLAGITIDSFRVGAGLLLFLSAVALVHGDTKASVPTDDIAVVPLAVPIIVGPATIGAILVMGAEADGGMHKIQALLALTLAIGVIGVILLLAGKIERLIKRRGIVILSKLTGLILAALASQMVMAGAKNLWNSLP